MHQIVYPITARLMHENKQQELNDLYKKTSINLQVVGGLVCWVFFVNINKLYDMPQLHDYKEGIMVVFMIGLSKYFELILGNNNAIILILNIIKQFCFLECFSCHIVLNAIFIPIYGIIGSAFATLLSITIYSLAKLLFCGKRLHLYPFTQTVTSLVVTFILFIILGILPQ
jgi:O-antigen/teichoic acid export membrane protein